MIIRGCLPSDAKILIDLSEKLDSETAFMLLEPGERTLTLDQQKKWLERVEHSDDEAVFIASNGCEAAGLVWVSRRPIQRVKHCFYLVIGVAQAYWRQGHGRRLMAAAEEWIVSMGGKRIELTVVASNRNAIGLYEHCGYQIEGTRRMSMFVDGAYIDELHMAKLLFP